MTPSFPTGWTCSGYYQISRSGKQYNIKDHLNLPFIFRYDNCVWNTVKYFKVTIRLSHIWTLVILEWVENFQNQVFWSWTSWWIRYKTNWYPLMISRKLSKNNYIRLDVSQWTDKLINFCSIPYFELNIIIIFFKLQLYSNDIINIFLI